MTTRNIALLGATYSAVPQVQLPISGGGTATFTEITDTTASASDVASGKYFYTSAGVRTQGTSSGGGGASNIVQGTFTTSSTTGAAQTVNISYSGSGYPVYIGIWPKNGYVSGSELYGKSHQYAMISYSFFKSNPSSAPTYSASGSNNQAYVYVIYKGSSTTNTAASRGNGANVYNNANATAAVASCVMFKNKNTMSVFVSSSSYGFLASTPYEYVIVYSS